MMLQKALDYFCSAVLGAIARIYMKSFEARVESSAIPGFALPPEAPTSEEENQGNTNAPETNERILGLA